MKSIELFAGIGGISLAAEWAGIETVAFCEIEPFAQKVLRKNWSNVPIFDDVKKLNKQTLKEGGIDVGTIDIISGGFPCQPYSIAGKRTGKEDDRDLWPEMFRIIQEIRPTWVVGENVANFIGMELERTIADLESEGYEVQSFLIPACGVNAPHRRDRVFVVAHSNSQRSQKYNSTAKPEEKGFSIGGDSKKILRYPHRESKLQTYKEASTIRSERETRESITREHRRTPPRSGWEINQPAVCRVDDGISKGLDRDRLKSLGNAVVPQQIYPIFEAIMKVKNL